MKANIFLSTPTFTGEETRYVEAAFKNGIIGNSGENLDAFEQQIQQNLKGKTAVLATSSGTAAIHLALQLLEVGPQDEVLCQSNTFIASANPILYQQATPVFIDSENDTWNMCPIALEQAILDRIKKYRKPKAILYVHLYGMPANTEAICALAEKYEIPVIEDAAEALGSSYQGKMCGTIGALSVLSFNSNKIITTAGGGALISRQQSYIKQALFLSTQAKDKAPYYQHSTTGYNYRMSNVNAGIGRAQIKKLSHFITKRRAINANYKTHLSDLITFQTEPNTDYFSNYWLTAGLLNQDPIRVIEKLAKKNIEARPLWKPMHLQPVFKDALFYGNGKSEQLFKSGICLPSSPNLKPEQQAYIIDTLRTVL